LVARQPLELVILVRVQAPEPSIPLFSVFNRAKGKGTFIQVLVRRNKFRITILYTGAGYGIIDVMRAARKITIEIPADLLDRAQRASGTGITQTIRTGLQLVAASRTYARLRQFRGKVRFKRTLSELKADR
jgi:hypothetical protein